MTMERCSTGQHLGAVLALVGLSLVLQAGLDMGRMVSHTPLWSGSPDQTVAYYIAAPASEDWGQTVLKLNGMP
ncbi:hypothetical protein [Roseospira visakhapatnamensis]|uniref:Uncharacterized protein n=1 Tax=Roseospira visakhapatnamensis TaxID=390880 RepID=A0A7W6RAM6_9PROT|nr:hypothetical protein [Roseospira visakhapatnamensis]MBB4264822.1 hypothetical protein [Roseospira visakhapatnamensis]